MAAATTDTAAPASSEPAPVSRRVVLEALSGLLMALFVAILSSTIVSNALPVILNDLNGTQAQYTWVVSAALLAMTSSTPIWGKLADLFSKKLLTQVAITIFIVGSMLCGIAQSASELIAFRVLQGLGMGGLQALAQIVIATIIPPRERGRYAGYLGAVMAVATVGGPLLGGVITDSPLGWRACFYVGVPIAAVALVVLQRTLSVPVEKREVKIDYLGATLIASGVSLLLIWTSFAGKDFAWLSATSLVWVGGGVLALALAVLVETRAAEPVVPLTLFRDRTTVLSTVASLCVGVAMFGATVFLTQFFQLARGATPTEAGLMTMPLVIGLFLSSTVVGQLITRYGKWKRYLVAGGVLLTAGIGALGVITRPDTPYWQLGVAMALMGLGIGMMMQNLVLAVQNAVALRNMGAASSTVAFFRSMGGAIGVSVLGAVLSTSVQDETTAELRALGLPADAGGGGGGQVPDLAALPAPIRTVVENAYGTGMSHVFLYVLPLSVIALVCVLFMRETALRRTLDIEPGPAAAEHVPAPGQDIAPEPETAETTEATGAATGHEDAEPGARPVVHGRVVGADGAAQPSAWLTLVDLSGRQRQRTHTEPDGTYRMAVPDTETYLLVCAAPGAGTNAELISASGAGVRHDVVLAENGTGVLSGTVRSGHSDAPLREVLATLTDSAGTVRRQVLTDADGRFRFDGLTDGTYTVIATSHPRAEHDAVIAGGDQVDMDVRLRPAQPASANRTQEVVRARRRPSPAGNGAAHHR